MSATFDLHRFLEAQDPVYDRVLAELKAGAKQSHWMWFIFPQIEGLGSSAFARRYAIASLEEGQAYLNHPVLGARLLECCTLLLPHPGRSAREIMGSPDDVKLRSCLTLFSRVAPATPVFQQLLDRYYGGRPDPATLARLPPT